MKRAFAATLLAAFAGSSYAILPDSGWYWNPSESGRGFNIEIQNNVLFMAAFVYDQGGNPIWLVTGGPMVNDHVYSGQLFQTTGGQCIGCQYSGSPQNIPYGTAAINFTSSMSAVISINGTAIAVQREGFALDFSNKATPLLGEWATTEGSPVLPLYFGERITFDQTQVLSSTGLTATGNMTGDFARIAVGTFGEFPGEWAILLDSSPSYYKLYRFQFSGFNLVRGSVSTFLKTSVPSGSLDFVAYRIESAAAAAGALAPGLKAAVSGGDDANAREAAIETPAGSEQLAQLRAVTLSLRSSLH